MVVRLVDDAHICREIESGCIVGSNHVDEVAANLETLFDVVFGVLEVSE